MLSKNLLLLALATVALAQNLTEALASQNATLSTFNALLSAQTALVETLAGIENITILAPSNDAIAKLLNSSNGAAIADPSAVYAGLEYTVLNGTYMSTAFTTTPKFIPTLLTNTSYTNVTGGQVVEAVLSGTEVNIYSALKLKSTVTKADITFTGGVIHIIDTVLTIPVSDAATLNATGETALLLAIEQLQLIDTINNLHEVTILAPDNAAIQAISPAVSSLSVSQFASILEYHVINGTVAYSTLLDNTTIKTLNGDSLKITVEDGDVFVNAARVILPDVLVANGVVHVIDNVLNPNNTNQALPSGNATAPPAYSGISSATTPSSTSASTSTSKGSATATVAAGAAKTAVIGAAALFGAGALLLNM